MWARVCIVGVIATIFAAPSMLTAHRYEEHAGSTVAARNDGAQWVKDKYERLSSLVPLTNWLRFGDTEASATMHAALWNGSAWDLHLSNRMAVNATLDILLGRDERLQMRLAEGSTERAAVRVLDAGSGWGGTVFFTESVRAAAAAMDSSRRLPLVQYDGLTLSPTQARWANDVALRKGLESNARFFVTSFDAELPSPPYAVVFAIESLEHSPNLDVTLRHLSDALLPSGMLVILTDVFEPREQERDASLVGDYRDHWCGPHTTPWMPPVDLPSWRAKLEKAGLGLVSHADLSASLYQRPRWGLTALLQVLRTAHIWAKSAGQRLFRTKQCRARLSTGVTG